MILAGLERNPKEPKVRQLAIKAGLLVLLEEFPLDATMLGKWVGLQSIGPQEIFDLSYLFILETSWYIWSWQHVPWIGTRVGGGATFPGREQVMNTNNQRQQYETILLEECRFCPERMCFCLLLAVSWFFFCSGVGSKHVSTKKS